MEPKDRCIAKLERLGVHTGGAFDPKVVAAICLVPLGIVFLATQIKRVPLPAAIVLAADGITYPLYLLHMQLGYVIFTALAPQQHVVPVTCAIVFGAFVLAYVIWRFFERSAHGATRMKFMELAERAGFSVGVKQTPRAPPKRIRSQRPRAISSSRGSTGGVFQLFEREIPRLVVQIRGSYISNLSVDFR